MKDAVGYIIKRLLEFVVSLVLLAFVVFSLLFISPGDPARLLVGTKKATPELLDQIRESFGLNDPFFTQFWHWVQGVFHGDFGTSIRTGQPVTEYVSSHAAASIQLVLLALILSIIVGLSLGIISAKAKGKVRDHVIDVSAIVGTSAPSFAVALLFLYIFAYKLKLFPMHGLSGDSFISNIPALILPAIVLCIGVSALLVKITRSAMLMEEGKDYTTFMRARAIRPSRITLTQLKNASAPILTSTGLILATLFGSTILVESVFSIPGLGNLLASSVTFHDVPVVQFIALVLAFIVCFAAAIIDILVYLINPLSHKRQKLAAKSKVTNSLKKNSNEIYHEGGGI
jgi:peptide/nickel transport system permease protein